MGFEAFLQYLLTVLSTACVHKTRKLLKLTVCYYISLGAIKKKPIRYVVEIFFADIIDNEHVKS